MIAYNVFYNLTLAGSKALLLFAVIATSMRSDMSLMIRLGWRALTPVACAKRVIRFLAYANPYLANDGILFETAREQGHFCLRPESEEVYLVDFGEFECGVLDFTRAETREWFAEYVLGREMFDIGIAGWMADFGEYLPTDVRLHDGSDPLEAHNRWPVLWAGDQSVDFTRHDGIGTVITAALSAGLVGNAYSHSDCGGYTSLLGNVRTEELMMRWCELAAFAPVMRSHEGNRPGENLQYDSTLELLGCFAHWSRVHAALAPYVRTLCNEAAEKGWPLQRAMVFHYPDHLVCYAETQDQFMYGSDLIVAPVIEEGATSRQVTLPGGDAWVHVFTGEVYRQGRHTIEAPIGRPPVFYRAGCPFASLPEVLEG